MSTMPRFLILWGDGINCENETVRAVEAAGGQAEKIHINELCENSKLLLDFQGMVIPGGFSFGDHLGSGQILSLKLERFIGEPLSRFVERFPVMGICNGFQTLLRLGLLPDADFKKSCALIENQQGHFHNEWVELERNATSACIWTRNLPEKFSLPARHGEGRFVCEEKTLRRLQNSGQIALRYSDDFNGSMDRIAGICNSSGLVFALMPHPEAAVERWQLPYSGEAFGLQFFKNAVEYLKG